MLDFKPGIDFDNYACFLVQLKENRNFGAFAKSVPIKYYYKVSWFRYLNYLLQYQK